MSFAYGLAASVNLSELADSSLQTVICPSYLILRSEMPELDSVEYPEGSQKRQEKEAELAREASKAEELVRGSDVPEEQWRGNGGQA